MVQPISFAVGDSERSSRIAYCHSDLWLRPLTERHDQSVNVLDGESDRSRSDSDALELSAVRPSADRAVADAEALRGFLGR
jgi:hypothetical protein